MFFFVLHLSIKRLQREVFSRDAYVTSYSLSTGNVNLRVLCQHIQPSFLKVAHASACRIQRLQLPPPNVIQRNGHIYPTTAHRIGLLVCALASIIDFNCPLPYSQLLGNTERSSPQQTVAFTSPTTSSTLLQTLFREINERNETSIKSSLAPTRIYTEQHFPKFQISAAVLRAFRVSLVTSLTN